MIDSIQYEAYDETGSVFVIVFTADGRAHTRGAALFATALFDSIEDFFKDLPGPFEQDLGKSDPIGITVVNIDIRLEMPQVLPFFPFPFPRFRGEILYRLPLDLALGNVIFYSHSQVLYIAH